MELITEPDIYSPSIDEYGNYVDKIPSFNIIKKGLLCPCGSRKDKFYDSHARFSTHIKTKNHQKWLTNLNLNKINYYTENEQLNQTIKNQRLIIASLEKSVNTKIMTIDYLTQQLNKSNKDNNCIQIHAVVNDLLDFD
jgi:hypothetical protein